MPKLINFNLAVTQHKLFVKSTRGDLTISIEFYVDLLLVKLANKVICEFETV